MSWRATRSTSWSPSNEIGRRAGSIWQELVKHGHVVGLEKGIEQILSCEPALQPHLTRAFIDALAPHETSVALSHYRAPAAELLTNLCRAIGLFEAVPGTEAATRASTLLLNQSLGATEAEILRSVNSWVRQAVGNLSTIPYNEIGALYPNLFNTPIWRNSVPLRPITVPPAHVAEALNRGRRELDDLRKLADEGRARIFGDLDTVEAALVEGRRGDLRRSRFILDNGPKDLDSFTHPLCAAWNGPAFSSPSFAVRHLSLDGKCYDPVPYRPWIGCQEEVADEAGSRPRLYILCHIDYQGIELMGQPVNPPELDGDFEC